MCVSMILLYKLMIGILLISGCGSDSEIVIEERAKQQLANLPGKIGITLKNSSGEWHYFIEKGMLQRVNSLPKALPQAATILRDNFDSPPGLPPQEGYVYWGPYLTSPSKHYIAAATATERHGPGSPGLAIIDVNINKTIGLFKGNESQYIRSIAWSPDSNWVAILAASSQLGILDRLVLSLLGHADSQMSWSLKVIDLSGKVFAETKLSELRSSWGWVVWMA